MAEVNDDARRALVARVLEYPAIRSSKRQMAVLDYLFKSEAPVSVDDISRDVFKDERPDPSILQIRAVIHDLRKILDEFFEDTLEGRQFRFRVVIPPGHAGYRLSFVENRAKKSRSGTKPAVFISSSVKGINIARELGHQLEAVADVNIWSEALFGLGRTAAESLTEAADRSDFAIFVVDGWDDSAIWQSKRSYRPNVMFELGFLAGRLGLDRTFIVVTDHKHSYIPIDLAGTMFIALPVPSGGELNLAVAPAADSIRKAIRGAEPRLHRAVDYYSCFISYSWKDQAFVKILHADLQEAGVRCWLDEKELRAGDHIAEHIDRALQAHDKVLLILSHSSVRSPWVRLELRNALRLEEERRKTVLFPLRLDDTALEMSGPEFDLLREKYVTDFSDWHDKGRYRRAFSGLVRDLAISTSVESGGRS